MYIKLHQKTREQEQKEKFQNHLSYYILRLHLPLTLKQDKRFKHCSFFFSKIFKFFTEMEQKS